eukprot:TRINITY_DN37438_c0_g1_i1.p2 TRINITY_DN37438_c0_g1~~TRINITY_DN37438_c0_g1_i1.p2  ORF type:complete len:254 (-),score=58.79 TRINITY_DN37438_c0_g1_i1:91-852(-)
MSYDRAITVFSPNGKLYQVEYAMEAVKKGNCAVAVRGTDCIVIAVEKKAQSKLQDHRTAHKICQVDDHIYLAFAGLMADARVLLQKARVHAQSYRLDYEDRVTVESLTRFVATTQHQATQRGGGRPFGVTTLIAGFDPDGTPRLYTTDPAGVFSSWRAASTGRNAKTVREALEKTFADGLPEDRAVSLAVRALLEVVESGAKAIEVLVVRADATKTAFLSEERLAAVLLDVESNPETATSPAVPAPPPVMSPP